MKHFRAFFGTLIFLAIIGVGFLFFRAAFVGTVQPGTAITFTVEANTGLSGVAALLEEKGLASALFYRLYSMFDEATFHPKAGSYVIHPGASYRAIARQLAMGQSKNEIELRVIEGWTLDDELRYLSERAQVNISKAAKMTGESVNRQSFDPKLRSAYAFLFVLPSSRSLEGYLFPDTYRVWEDQLPQSLVDKQLQEFWDRFGAVQIGPQTAPLKSLDDVVILASLVEKEVRTDADRPIVAGIFLNRLRDGMALQSDASLAYAVGSAQGKTSLLDLTIDTPYNLYKNRGLPPSPICNPGAASIDAVLNPVASPYRFFLTDATGKVYYGKTFEEHVANRRKAGL